MQPGLGCLQKGRGAWERGKQAASWDLLSLSWRGEHGLEPPHLMHPPPSSDPAQVGQTSAGNSIPTPHYSPSFPADRHKAEREGKARGESAGRFLRLDHLQSRIQSPSLIQQVNVCWARMGHSNSWYFM